MTAESEFEFENGAESPEKARRHVSPCVRRRHPAKQRVKRHRDDMTTSSREKKRRAQAGKETGERKTQGRKSEAGSLPGSKTAQKAQKGAWETQLFYVIDVRRGKISLS